MSKTSAMTGLAKRAVAALVSGVLLASCGLLPGTAPAPTGVKRPAFKPVMVKFRHAPVLTMSLMQTSSEYELPADVIAYYPDGSPKTYHIAETLKLDGLVVMFETFYWDTDEIINCSRDLGGSAAFAEQIDLPQNAQNIRGAANYGLIDVYKATLSVNGVNKNYINSPTLGGVSWRFIDTGFVAGTNTVKFSGQTFDQSWVNSYGCTFAALNMNVDLTWDVPPPGSEPTPTPSTGSPSPDPSATPSGGGSGDPNGSPSPGGSSDPNATPSPGDSGDPNGSPSPGVSPGGSSDPNPSTGPNGSPSPSATPSDGSGSADGTGGSGGAGGDGGTGGTGGTGGAGGSGGDAGGSNGEGSPQPSNPPASPTPSGMPTGAPSTPSAGPITLQLADPLAGSAFSPNGDGIKDYKALAISATGSWTLKVIGVGTISNGSGVASISWSGTANGSSTPLPDGKYSLVVTAAGASSDPIEVVIDTTAPTTSNIAVEPRREQLGATIRATLLDPIVNGASSGIDKETIEISCNGRTITGGGRSYDPSSGAFLLSLSQDDVYRLSLPSGTSQDEIKFTASDAAGVGTVKSLSVSSGYAVANEVKKGTYSLAALKTNDTLVRPLLGQKNYTTVDVPNVTSSVPGAYRLVVTPPGSLIPLAGVTYIYPPWVDHTFVWDAKDATASGRFVPLPAGVYSVRGFIWGIIPHEKIDVTVDNNIVVDWRSQPADWNAQNHIIWGSKRNRDQGKYHNWSFYAPGQINDAVPETNHPKITALYNTYVLPVIRQTATWEHAISEVPDNRGGALVEYFHTVGGHAVTVKSYRLYSQSADHMVEKITDAWVN